MRILRRFKGWLGRSTLSEGLLDSPVRLLKPDVGQHLIDDEYFVSRATPGVINGRHDETFSLMNCSFT